MALAARRKRLPTTSPMETLVSIDDEMRLLYLCGEHDNFQFTWIRYNNTTLFLNVFKKQENVL